MTYNEFLELDYWNQQRELARLVEKRGDQSNNLTTVEQKCYEVACTWYDDNHR